MNQPNLVKRVTLGFIFFFSFLFLFNSNIYAAIPAFPGAEGFGADTPGGRGGRVYVVNTLQDTTSSANCSGTNTCTLRDCVNAVRQSACTDSSSSQTACARTCVFNVGGSITLNSQLSITKPYMTIVGQTAPGDGILLRMGGNIGEVVYISTHDIVMRYITIRPGPPKSARNVNGIGMYKNNPNDETSKDIVHDIVLDHLSMSWTNDRILYTWYGTHDYSIQWSIFAEPLDCNNNAKYTSSGCRDAKTVMLGSQLAGESSSYPGGKNVSFHHNLMTDGRERNPNTKPAGLTEVISNVSYNAQWSYAQVDMENKLANVVNPVNFIGNYFRKGEYNGRVRYDGDAVDAIYRVTNGAKIFVQGNIGSTRPNSTYPEKNIMSSDAQQYYTATRNSGNPPFPITTTSCNADPINGGACITYTEVMSKAGNNQRLEADGSFVTRRDMVDQRILAEVSNRDDFLIDAPSDETCMSPFPGNDQTSTCRYPTRTSYTKYGLDDNKVDWTTGSWFKGWPIIAGGIPYPDSDNDGISDTWENNKFGNLAAASNTTDADSDGYTDLEEFLNGTNPKGANITPTMGPSPTTGMMSPTPTSTPKPSTSPTLLPGDANGDNKVDGIDYVIWLNHYSQNVSGASNGDFNNDGKVDGIDYVIWLNHYGM